MQKFANAPAVKWVSWLNPKHNDIMQKRGEGVGERESERGRIAKKCKLHSMLGTKEIFLTAGRNKSRLLSRGQLLVSLS